MLGCHCLSLTIGNVRRLADWVFRAPSLLLRWGGRRASSDYLWPSKLPRPNNSTSHLCSVFTPSFPGPVELLPAHRSAPTTATAAHDAHLACRTAWPREFSLCLQPG